MKTNKNNYMKLVEDYIKKSKKIELKIEKIKQKLIGDTTNEELIEINKNQLLIISYLQKAIENFYIEILGAPNYRQIIFKLESEIEDLKDDYNNGMKI